MPYKVVKRRPVRKIMKRKQYKKSVSAVSPVVKSYVKRMLSVRAEDKVAPNISQSPTSCSPMSATLINPINLANVWNIAQGTQQGNRIANSLSPKSWRLKGYFAVPWGTNVSVPMLIKMYVLKQRSGYGSPTSSTTFYQNGNSSLAPTSTFNDMLKSVNGDIYTLYTTRTFKLGTASLDPTLNGTSNNDFKNIAPFNINCLKYQNHTMKYSDATLANPTNAGLYFCYTVCRADGSAVNLTTDPLPTISFEIEATYEDS